MSIPSPGSRGTALAELRDLENRAQGLAGGGSDPEPSDLRRITHELVRLLERALELLDVIGSLQEGTGTRLGDNERCGGDSMARRFDIADLRFAVAFELRRALEKLRAAESDDHALVAAETARRKLRRGVQAILTAAREADGSAATPALSTYPHAEVQSALSVRRLYRDFRRALRRPVDDSAEAVLVALRYAAGAIATLVSAPGYADVRASDKTVFRRLHQRILNWARDGQVAAVGLALLEDVHTCSVLLRSINRRQELRAHDATVLRALRHGSSGDSAAFLAQLDALVGMDEVLDRLIERVRVEPPQDVFPALMQRLAEME